MEKEIHIDQQIKDTIRIVKDVMKHILSYWYLALIFVILALAIVKMKKQESTVAYVATLTFTMNQTFSEDASSTEDEAAKLITDIGIGGGGSRMGLSAARLVELSKTNTVLAALLFRKAEMNGKEDYLANHFINLYMENIADSAYFQTFVSLDSLNRAQNSVVNRIVGALKTKHIFFSVSNSMIFSVNTQSVNEEFSMVLAKSFYDALCDLHIRGSISKATANFKFAEDRYKQATQNLLAAEASLANWQDRNNNLVRRSAYLSQTQLQREVEIYNAIYREALSSYEQAQVNLENQKPIFLMIDPPRYPLKKVVTTNSSNYLLAILGAISFFLFITITLYFYKQYGYLLKEILDA